MLKKVMTGAAIALTLGGAALATATPAAAAPWGWRGGGWHGGRGYGGGAVLGAGILGLAVGAAVAGGPHYYGYPPPGYYAGPAYYGYYGGCHSHWRWDPYMGRYVMVERCY
jgi:hypothetical protein